MFEDIIGDAKLRRQREAAAQKQVFAAGKATILPLLKRLETAQELFETLKPKATDLLQSIQKLSPEIQDYCIQFTNELSALIYGCGGLHVGTGEALKQAKQDLLTLRAEDFQGTIYGRGATRASALIEDITNIPANNGRIEELLKLIAAAVKRVAESKTWFEHHGEKGAAVTLLRAPEPVQARIVDSEFNLLG